MPAFCYRPQHLNTPRQIYDQNQTLVWKWDQQEPFGNDTPNGDPGNTGAVFELPSGLSGYYRDKETGNSYAMLRDCYDPSTGRFCQSDPIGLLGGVGTYNYVGSRPLNAVDPTGECPWCIGGALIGGGITLYTQLQEHDGNWNQVNWVAVGLSAATGAIGGGAGAFIYSKTTSVLANALLNGAVNSTSNAAATAIQNLACKEDQSVLASAALNFGLGVIGGAGGAKLANVATRTGAGAQNWINTSTTNVVNTLLPPKPGQIPFQYQGASVGSLITGAGGVTANVTGNFISNAGPLIAP
ncbi:MAG TPA: RHS repeat-associated core domain-containing protein [Burkholderiales bacterium]|nr:RHS repeat-associated core domain-containing protein [Burkholderiales bacterium]